MMLLSWSMILILFLVVPLDAGQDVSRINQGVEFQHLASLSPTTTHWFHTFVIPVPDNPFLNYQEILFGQTANQSQSNWLLSCLNHHDNITYAGNQSSATGSAKTSMGDTRPLCFAFNDEFSHLVNVIKKNHVLLSSKYRSIRALLPAPIRLSAGRKRGLMDFVGSVANSLFGVATDKQLNTVLTHVRKFTEMAQQNNGRVAQTLHDLSSFSSAVDQRLTGMVDAVRRSSLHSLDQYRTYAASSSYRFQFLQQVIRKSTEINHAAWTLAQHLETFFLGMSMLSVGKLPIELLDRDVILQVMHVVLSKVRRSVDSRFRLVKDSPWDYYKSSNFVYSYSNGYLMINVDFPLTIFEESFDIYQVLTLPLTMANLPNGTMLLKTDVHAIAFHKVQDYYFTLTDVEIAKLKLSTEHMSDVHILHKTSKDHCLSSIFYEWTENAKENCQYEISIHRKLFSDIISLGSHQFLLINIRGYNVSCNESYVDVYFSGCEHCVVTLQAGCTLTTPDLLVLSPEVDTRSVSDDHNTSTHSFTVNRPLLANFFTEEDLQAVRGDTLLTSPPQIQLPNLTLFQHPADDFIAQDEILRLDMHKTMESMKKNAIILHSKADSMQYNEMMQQLESHNLFGDYADIISLVVIACGFVFLCCMFWMFLKIRALSISLAVLTTTLPRAQALPLVLAYTPPPMIFPNSSVVIPLVEFLKTIHTSPSTQFYVFTFAIILGLVIGNVAYLILSRRRSIQIKTIVALSFSTAETSILISLLTIHDLPTSLELRCVDFVHGMNVLWSTPPVLVYKWSALVQNVTSNQPIQIATRVTISPWQYFKLKKILRSAYTVLPIFVHNDLITQPEIHKLDNDALIGTASVTSHVNEALNVGFSD